MNVDPLIVRLVFVGGTIFGFGSFILIYLAIALLAD
jgi:phage shock protein PspC (stress-responsive transcriptional regulator)